jgi:hypothetical protein
LFAVPHFKIETGARPENSEMVLEYFSRMLHEMLRILSQPPGWLSSTFSTLMGAVVGFFSGLIGQLIVPDFVGRRNMRIALYRDIADMFSAVDLVMNVEESLIGPGHPDTSLWRQEQFRQFPFLGEDYYSDSPAIYIQLPERFAVQTLYRKLKFVLEQPPASLPFNARNLAGTVAFYVDVGVLRRKYFSKYLRRKNAKALLHKVDEYNRQRKDRIQRLIDEAEAQVQHAGPDVQ